MTMDEEKPNISKYSGMHEENIDIIFWKIAEMMVNGEIDKVKSYTEYATLLPPILAKYINYPTTTAYLLDVSPPTLCHHIFKFFLIAKCNACFIRAINQIKRKFPVVLGIVRLINEERGKIEGVIKDMLNDMETRLIALEVVKNLDKETGKLFLNEIMNIARNDIGEAQYMALEILTSYIDMEEVEELFINYLDDWDPKVKAISAVALLNGKNKEKIVERVKSAMALERDKYVQFLYKRLLNKFGGESNDA